MNVLGREVEVLRNIKEIIQLLNQVQEAKYRNDDINDRLKLIKEEKNLIIELISNIELLHSILRELYSRRTSRVFDSEVIALLQSLIELIQNLQDYVNILQQEIDTGFLTIPKENDILIKLGKAFDIESNLCQKLLRKIERHGGDLEIIIYKKIQRRLNRFREGWFNYKLFQLVPVVNLCTALALFGTVACGNEIIVEAPRSPQTEQREII